jgi:hypothetical protein
MGVISFGNSKWACIISAISISLSARDKAHKHIDFVYATLLYSFHGLGSVVWTFGTTICVVDWPTARCSPWQDTEQNATMYVHDQHGIQTRNANARSVCLI